MTLVNSKEFASHQKKYFDMAVNERVCIRRGRNMFHLIYSPVADEDSDDDAELLALAKSRMNDEFISGEEYMNFMNSVINGTHSREKSNKRV